MTIDFGIVLQADRLVAGDDALAIDLDPGNAPRLRPGGNDDLLQRGQRLLLAFGHLDLAAAGQTVRCP